VIVGVQRRVLMGQLFGSVVLECQYVRVLERRVLICVSCFGVRSCVREKRQMG